MIYCTPFLSVLCFRKKHLLSETLSPRVPPEERVLHEALRKLSGSQVISKLLILCFSKKNALKCVNSFLFFGRPLLPREYLTDEEIQNLSADTILNFAANFTSYLEKRGGPRTTFTSPSVEELQDKVSGTHLQ